MTAEERLRSALRHGTPRPLDGPTIIASARRRRTMEFARIAAVSGALFLVVGFALAMIIQTFIGAGVRGSTAQAPAPAQASSEALDRGLTSEDNSDAIPGRRLVVQEQRWCLVRSGDAGVIKCATRAELVMRVPDEQGAEWLVLLAPSGARTAVLQAEQRNGWVTLNSSQVHGSTELWIGVQPTSQVPEVPRTLRALDAEGREIWT
ncbi:MAG: hypothetical protein Q4G46_11520, partial [Propionibacteriaceae bacterium]|nr:hypothetical protein [Propionibacteriaceae bacterium]